MVNYLAYHNKLCEKITTEVMFLINKLCVLIRVKLSPEMIW